MTTADHEAFRAFVFSGDNRERLKKLFKEGTVFSPGSARPGELRFLVAGKGFSVLQGRGQGYNVGLGNIQSSQEASVMGLDSVEGVRDDIADKLKQFKVYEDNMSPGSPTQDVKPVGTDEVLIRTKKGDKYVAKVRKLDD